MAIGLGCMRLSTEPERDDARALATLHAAFDAGITLFDTARAYALDGSELGHNERLLARAFAAHPERERVRIVTKGGMTRDGTRWVIDGRAKSIRADCEASREALGGLPVEVYLLHAPDPDVPFATSVRALAALLEAGLVKRIGLSNVNRSMLEEALAIAPISAVEVSLGWHDDTPLKGGLVALAVSRGLDVLAHRPLGGPDRARRLRRDRALASLAEALGAAPAEVALAAIAGLHPSVTPLPGATRPETARSAAAAARLRLDDPTRERLLPRVDRRFVAGAKAPEALDGGEVVLLMGLQGTGKTDAAASWVAKGYERFSRDERGGTMAQLHRHLDERLRAGVRRAVLDNTYVTRAARREAIEIAWRHKLRVRGVWHDAPLAEAQVNVVLRMLRAHGRLLEPHEMKNAGPAELPPHAQHRLLRQLERPALDEGWSELSFVSFVRRPREGAAGRFIAREALVDGMGRPKPGFAAALGTGAEPRFVFAWSPAKPGLPSVLAEAGCAYAECLHGAGPQVCWCRPPLPGLVLAFCERHGVDPAKSVLVGTSPAHRAMAAALGARYEEP